MVGLVKHSIAPKLTARAKTLLIGIVLAAYILSGGRAVAQGSVDSQIEAIIADFEQIAEEHTVRDGIGALSWAIVSGEDLVWSNGFGWANWELRRPANPGSVFPTGSFTSAITVTLLLQLAEQGVIAIDDLAVRYVPELTQLYGPPGYANSISLRQLATHTGGLMHSPPLPYSVPGAGNAWQFRLVELIPSTPLYYVPGEMYYYSGVGLGLLALALTRAAEYPLQDLAEELIFGPLGMVMSGFELTPMMEDALAVGRISTRRMPITPVLPSDVPRRYENTELADAGAYTTVEDLARFVSGLLGTSRYQILTGAGSSGIIELGLTEARGDAAGLMVRGSQYGDRLVGYGGTNSGHNAFFDADIGTGLGVLILRSYEAGANEIEQAASLALDRLVELDLPAAGIAGSNTRASTAVPFREVERRPVRLSCGPLVYPTELLQDAAAEVPDPAAVTLDFVIGLDGRVESEGITVIASPDSRFNAAAIDWALTCAYSPGSEGGAPVKVSARQTVNFVRPS